MAEATRQDLYEMDSLRAEVEKKTTGTQKTDIRRAWALFLAIGLPAGLLAALAPLTMAGIYLEPLRPLWRPWPPDVLKPFIGIAVFCATLAYLAFRSGRLAGLRSGTVAAIAALRNVLERRAPAVARNPPPPPAPPVVEVAAAPGEQPPMPPPPPPAEETPKVDLTP